MELADDFMGHGQAQPTYKQLLAQAKQLELQAEQMRIEESRAAIAKIKALIAEYDLSAQDLGLVKVQELKPGRAGPATFKRKTGAGTRRGVIYADPETGKTWNGWGKAPHWIASAENRDDFIVKNPTEA
jgi:DNA-binding protein H-NS